MPSAMNQTPSTPVKVPSAAATYTPATLDPDLRSQVNTVLIRDGHVSKIQDHLLHTLNAHQSNWPTNVQAHALALLRSGEATTFPELLVRVMKDIRAQTTTGTVPAVNGSNSKKVNGELAANSPLAVPKSALDEALKVTREALETEKDVKIIIGKSNVRGGG